MAMMPKRTTCQVVLFIVWLLGLIIAAAIYESAIFTIKNNPVMLFSGAGAPGPDWLVPTDWESKMADKYEAPLAAIYTPWLLVMVGGVLAGVQRSSADRISGAIFVTTFVLSLLFNTLLCWMLWEFLFHLKPLDNEIPSKSPIIALLISIIGAFVTYNFPKAEDPPTTQPPPAANPATPPS
jgi:hypothetical protein